MFSVVGKSLKSVWIIHHAHGYILVFLNFGRFFSLPRVPTLDGLEVLVSSCACKM